MNVLRAAHLDEASYQRIVLLLLLTTVFTVRFSVLNRYSTPPSEDLGGDLALLDAYTSPDAVRPDYQYHSPPAYHFAVVWTFTGLLPTFAAIKLYAALIPTLMGLPFFILSKDIAKSVTGPMVATLLFVFSEPYNEMIGWGGILNALGIFFMLLSVYYGHRVLKEGQRRDASLAGIFASLTIGTHHLTAVYLVISATAITVLLIVFQLSLLRRRLGALSLSAVIAIVLSMPFMHVYVWGLRNTVNIGASSDDLSLLIGQAPVAVANLAREIPSLVVLLALSIPAAACLVKGARQDPGRLVTLGSLASLIPLSLLLKPETLVRASYYAAIPLFVCVAVLVSRIIRCSQGSGNKSVSLGIIVLLLVLVVGVLSLESYRRLVTAVDYYQILSEDSLAALDWIHQNTPRGATFFTNYVGLKSWIEGYSRRLAFDSRPLTSLVTEREFRETQIANMINLGNYGLEGEHLRVGDDFPSGYNNPGVHLRIPGYQIALLFFYDELQTIHFTQIDLPQALQTNLLSAQDKSTEQCFSAPNGVSRTYEYKWIFGTVRRTVDANATSGVTVTYQTTIPEGEITNFSITASFNNQCILQAPDIGRDGSFSVRVSAAGKKAIVELAPVTEDTKYVKTCYSAAERQVTFSLEPFRTSCLLAVSMRIKTSTPAGDWTLGCWDSHDLLSQLGVTHILVDKNHYGDYVRWAKNCLESGSSVFDSQRLMILEFV